MRAAAVGTVTGVLSGLFGIGGGILVVPALVFFLGLDARPAAATSLAAVVPVAGAGLAGYAADGRVDLPVAVLLAVGAVAGSLVGTFLLHRIAQRALLWAFAVLLVALAIGLLLPLPEPADGGAVDAGVAAIGLGLGGVAGVLSGLFGVGGGFVTVPGMVLLLSEASAVAKGTSLLVILPTALTGTWRNARRGLVDWPVAAVVGGSGALLAFLSSRLSVGLDEALSNRLFAVLLVVVAVRTLASVLGMTPGPPHRVRKAGTHR